MLTDLPGLAYVIDKETKDVGLCFASAYCKILDSKILLFTIKIVKYNIVHCLLLSTVMCM